jgi:hypothetical protein
MDGVLVEREEDCHAFRRLQKTYLATSSSVMVVQKSCQEVKHISMMRDGENFKFPLFCLGCSNDSKFVFYSVFRNIAKNRGDLICQPGVDSPGLPGALTFLMSLNQG